MTDVNERAVVGDQEPDQGLGLATRAALGRAIDSRPRRWLIAATLCLGVLSAAAVAAGSPADRSFLTVSGATQGLMSITVPLTGVLLAGDLRRRPGLGRLAPTLLAAGLVAAAVGIFGVFVSAIAVAVAASGPASEWDQVVVIASGSVLVQVVAQLVGTGLGQLVRPAIVAFLASIVVPLGLWFLLGQVPALASAQAWLTPFANVQRLYDGQMHGLAWVRWAVAILLWGVGLNVLGAWLRPRVGPASGLSKASGD